MGNFLVSRDLRFKPKDPEIKGLKRIEKIDFSGNIFISEKPSNTDMILIKKGDLVISGINVEKGAMAVYQGEEDITATIHYSAYEFDETKIDLGYLTNFLRSKKFTDALKEQVPGGIKTEIKPKHILPLEVEIPTDIEDQKRIIRDFESRNNKVKVVSSENIHQLNLLKKLRQQILQDAVQGKLVNQDSNDEPASVLLERIKAEKEQLIKEKKIKKDKPLPEIKPNEIPYEIPENWVWCRLGEISSVVRGGSPRPAGDKRFYDGDIPFLKVADLTADDNIYLNSHTYTIKEAGLHKTRYVDSKTLMLTNSGATLGVPKICMFPTTFNDGIAAFLGINNMDMEFIYYFLKSKTGWYLKEASRGQGQPNLNTDIISMTPFALPPFREQNLIVRKIEQLMTLCDELEQSIQQNQKYTQELVQVALKEALERKT